MTTICGLIFFVFFVFFSSPNNGHTPTRYQNYKPWTKFGTLWKVYVYGRLWLRALTWCLCYTRWQTHQLEFHTAHQLLGYWPYCMEGHSSWVQSVTIGASWYIEHFAKVGMDMDSCAKEMRKEFTWSPHPLPNDGVQVDTLDHSVLSFGRTSDTASNHVERELLAHGILFMLLGTIFSSWHHIQIQVSVYQYFSKFLSQALLGFVSCLVRCIFFYQWKTPFD